MKFSRLINESRLFWPQEISISDGETGSISKLNEVWDRVEQIQDNINEWHQIMSYVIYCGFCKQAREKFKIGDLSPIEFSEIDFRYVNLRLREHLSQTYPSWARSMRNQYVSDVYS